MESTVVYWIPLYEILEERGFQVVLVNAPDVHNVRGRKSDVSGCEWLQELHSVGLLGASFRPAGAIVPLRPTCVTGRRWARNRQNRGCPVDC